VRTVTNPHLSEVTRPHSCRPAAQIPWPAWKWFTSNNGGWNQAARLQLADQCSQLHRITSHLRRYGLVQRECQDARREVENVSVDWSLHLCPEKRQSSGGPCWQALREVALATACQTLAAC